MNYFILRLIAFMCLSVTINAQENEGDFVLNKVYNSYLNKDNFTLKLEYNLFKGYTKDSLSESYKGSVAKTSGSIRANFLGYTTYAYNDHQITISEKEKVIYVSQKSIDMGSGLLYAQLNILREIGEVHIKHSNKKNIFVEILLLSEISYSYPYAKVDLVIDKSTYSITNQTLYFREKKPFKIQKGDVVEYYKACMEVKVLSSSEEINDFYESKHFVIKQSNGKLSLTQKYKNFKLIDKRNNQ